jgi:hypothetical protein
MERTRGQALPAPESVMVDSEEELFERLMATHANVENGHVMSKEDFYRRIKEKYGFSA